MYICIFRQMIDGQMSNGIDTKSKDTYKNQDIDERIYIYIQIYVHMYIGVCIYTHIYMAVPKAAFIPGGHGMLCALASTCFTGI